MFNCLRIFPAHCFYFSLRLVEYSFSLILLVSVQKCRKNKDQTRPKMNPILNVEFPTSVTGLYLHIATNHRGGPTLIQ